MTGHDIVKALTESGLLDKEIESFDYDVSDSSKALAIFEKSNEYLGNGRRKYTDIHLIISEDGKWALENVTWIA